MRLLFCSIFLYINIGCVTKHIADGSEQAVRLKIHWQLVGEQNGKAEVMEVIDSVFVINRAGYFVYLIPHVTEHSKITVNKDNEVISNSLLSETTSFIIYIFQDKDSLGLKFDSLSAKTGTKFNVDSFLINKTFKGMKSYNEENDSLVSKTYFDSNTRVLETYVPKTLYENSFDSAYFFFTKEKIETNISFSKLLEEKRKMKLYKLIGVYNAIPVGKYPFAIPKREMIWELKNINLPFDEKIDNLIRKYSEALH